MTLACQAGAKLHMLKYAREAGGHSRKHELTCHILQVITALLEEVDGDFDGVVGRLTEQQRSNLERQIPVCHLCAPCFSIGVLSMQQRG